jgi:hypothetical protein
LLHYTSALLRDVVDHTFKALAPSVSAAGVADMIRIVSAPDADIRNAKAGDEDNTPLEDGDDEEEEGEEEEGEEGAAGGSGKKDDDSDDSDDSSDDDEAANDAPVDKKKVRPYSTTYHVILHIVNSRFLN